MNYKKNLKIFTIFSAMLIIALKSPLVIDGAKNGLTICFSSVIPSLFPFMVLSSAFVGNIGGDSFKILSRITKGLFGISQYGTGAFLCGIMCGYPIGAKCTAELYRDGKISSSEAESLIAYSNNCGPLFVIGAVGLSMIGSYKTGAIIYFIHIIASVISAIILKPYTYTKHISPSTDLKNRTVTECICESVTNISAVCGFVIFFAVINNLTGSLAEFLPGCVKGAILCFMEITNGINYVCNNIPNSQIKLALISLALGWSGLSVHMQVKNIIRGLELSMKKYYIVRIFNGFFSAALTFLCYGGLDTVLTVIKPKYLSIVPVAFATIAFVMIIITYKKRDTEKSKLSASLKLN